MPNVKNKIENQILNLGMPSQSNHSKSPIKESGFKPNKLLGQNFLVDRTVLKKIIGAADLSAADTVLEIGPGLGALTQELIKLVGQVVAVEKDKALAARLKEKFAALKNIKIVEGDILKLLAWAIEQLNDYKVVANIPYYLTARLLRKFLESTHPPKLMLLMLQKEVAQRICAKPPKMSLLAVATQFYAEPKIISQVSKKSFWPSPKVDSAIVKFVPCSDASSQIHPNAPNISSELFFKVVKAGFSQPRKQLAGNLTRQLKIERPAIEAALKKIGLAPNQRAETLSVNDWIKLSQTL